MKANKHVPGCKVLLKSRQCIVLKDPPDRSDSNPESSVKIISQQLFTRYILGYERKPRSTHIVYELRSCAVVLIWHGRMVHPSGRRGHPKGQMTLWGYRDTKVTFMTDFAWLTPNMAGGTWCFCSCTADTSMLFYQISRDRGRGDG